MRYDKRRIAIALGICCLTVPPLSRSLMADDLDHLDRARVAKELPDIDPAMPEHQSHHGRPAHHEKVAFLGITADEPTPALRSQLQLPRGTGLLVDRVLPDSPAEKAGLLPFDVLQKLEDQLLVDQRQLSVLVQLHKPGEEIKLTVIREGALKAVAVKLGETEMEPSHPKGHPWDMPWREMRNLPWREFFQPEGQPRGPRDTHEHGRPRVLPPTTRPSGTSVHTWVEDGSLYVITMRNGHRYVTATRDGQNTFEGLIDNDEQVRKLPGDIRDKVEKVLRGDRQSDGGVDGSPSTRQ